MLHLLFRGRNHVYTWVRRCPRIMQIASEKCNSSDGFKRVAEKKPFYIYILSYIVSQIGARFKCTFERNLRELINFMAHESAFCKIFRLFLPFNLHFLHFYFFIIVKRNASASLILHIWTDMMEHVSRTFFLLSNAARALTWEQNRLFVIQTVFRLSVLIANKL